MPFFNFSSDSDSDELVNRFHDIKSFLHYLGQALLLIYVLSACIWLFYVIRKIRFHLKEKRLLEAKRSSGILLNPIELEYKISSAKSELLRFWIFFIFVFVELIFGLDINIYGPFVSHITPISVYLGYNCTLQANTYLAQWYVLEPYYFLKNLIMVLSRFAYSLMICLFGISLLNLSHAALERIHAKKIIKYILIVFFINLIIAVGNIIPYTSLAFAMIQSLMDQIGFFILLYIVRKRFFPAMHSRGRYALQNIDTEKRKRIESRKQETLLKLYKYVIVFFMITFEIGILKALIFYNGVIILESISINPCWFTVTYQLPVFQLSALTVNILFYIGLGFLTAEEFINIIVFFNFTLMNVTIDFVTSWPRLRQQFAMRNKSYRFHIKRY